MVWKIGGAAIAALLSGNISYALGATRVDTAAATLEGVSETADGRRYSPVYFQRITPRTAADMLFDIPGFTVRRNGSGRGLGQGGVNVLINGARVTGKETDPIDILEQTAASAVTEIRITDAARLNIPGLTGEVADVRLKKDQRSGSWAWHPSVRRGTAVNLFDGRVSMSGTLPGMDYRLSLENDARRRGNRGNEYVFDASRTLTEVRYEYSQNYGELPRFDGALTFHLNNGWTANLSGAFQKENTREDEISLSSKRNTFFSDDGDKWLSELNGDLAIPALGSDLKLITLHRQEDDPTRSVQLEIPSDGNLTQRVRDDKRERRESIARVEQSWDDRLGGSIQWAAEAAYNVLKTTAQTTNLGAQGEIITPIAEREMTRVEERRVEMSLAYGRALTDKLDIQGSIAVERSTLTLPLTTLPDRTFTRPKGFLSASYALNPDTDIRARLERRVGQLDFNNFVSAVDLQEDVDEAGNVDIVPSQSWFANFEAERRYGDDSTISFELFAEQFTDIVDRIPFDTDDAIPGPDADGPGNIPEGEEFGARASTTLALDQVGIEGGELRLDLSVKETNLTDPLTGQERDFSNNRRSAWSFDFEQDIPGTDIGYGFGGEQEQYDPTVRFNRLSWRRNDIRSYAFVEHRDV